VRGDAAVGVSSRKAVCEHVLLLHGIWMVPGAMRLLARHLGAAGYVCETFGYGSLSETPELAAARLIDRLRALAVDGRVHLVAHSLGGLIALEAARRWVGSPSGRIVCLGSPIKGSTVAQRLATLPMLSALTGRSAGLLARGEQLPIGDWQVGMIAGRRALGLGRLIGVLPRPNDGTVAVIETESPGLTDHCVLDCAHTELIASACTAEYCIRFLRTGRFAA
jgi:pimeloyl-ACP methyl ester carboxylesterase